MSSIYTFGTEFDDINLSGLGSVDDIQKQFLDSVKKHLVNTKKIISENNVNYLPGYSSASEFVSDINYLLANWDNPITRDAALDRLEAKESLGLFGLGGLFSWVKKGVKAVGKGVSNAAKWTADKVSDAAKAVGKGVSNASKWTWDKAKDAGKAIIKYNPAGILIRAGLRGAFKQNLFHISEKLGYGYLTKEQANALGISTSTWEDYKDKLRKVINIYKGFQGKESLLRSEILIGWQRGCNKHGRPWFSRHDVGDPTKLPTTISDGKSRYNTKTVNLGGTLITSIDRSNTGLRKLSQVVNDEGLGEPVSAAATAAAAPVVATIVKIVSTLTPIVVSIAKGKKPTTSNQNNQNNNNNNQQPGGGQQQPGQYPGSGNQGGYPQPDVKYGSTGKSSMNMLLIGGAGLAAIYFLMK